MGSPPPFPLEQFLHELEAAGFAVDTRTRIRVQQVLQEVGKGFAVPTEQLGLYLSPILAHSEAEQVQFGILWKRFLKGEIGEEPPIVTVVQPQPSKWARLGRFVRRPIVWGSALAVAIGLFLGWMYLVPFKLEPFVLEAEGGYGEIILEGDSATFRASTPLPEGVSYHWRLVPQLEVQPDTISIPNGDAAWGHRFPEPGVYNVTLQASRHRLWRKTAQEAGFTVQVLCMGRPDWKRGEPRINGLKVDFQAHPKEGYLVDSVKVEWEFGDGATSTDPNPAHIYDSARVYTAALRVVDPRYPDCPYTDLAVLDLRGKSEQAALPDLDPPLPTYTYWRSAATGMVLGFAGILGLLVWAGLRWPWQKVSQRQRDTLKKKFAPDRNGPYHIPWPAQEHLIAWDAQLDRLAALMAGRSHRDRLHLDARATIGATIRAAGFPALKYRSQSQPLEWLVLLDEGSLTGQEIKLCQWLLRKLQNESVVVDAFMFRDTPEFCWRDGQPTPLPLHVLQAHYPRHCLIVISRGGGLLHPLRNAIRKELNGIFQHWGHRTLLTPEHPATWGSREKALSVLFGICPVESAAMLNYFMLPHPPNGENYVPWRRKLLQTMEAHRPHPPRWGSFEAMAKGLPAQQTQWAVALHAYPEPLWELTLAAGAALQGAKPAVQWDALWAMFRLPFMREGRFSRPLLNAAAEMQSDGAIQVGRSAMLQLLEGAAATLERQGLHGHAGTKVQREQTLVRYALTPHDPNAQLELQALAAAGMAGNVKPPEPKKQKHWSFALPFVVAAGIVSILIWTGSLVAFGGTKTCADDLKGHPLDWAGLTVLDSVEDPLGETAQIHNTLAGHYQKGRVAYKAQQYAVATDAFLAGKRVADNASSPAVGEMALPLFWNALGLCAYYAQDIDTAMLYYSMLIGEVPDFYSVRHRSIPNLQSLLDTTVAVKGIVREKGGRPLPDVTFAIYYEGEPTTIARSDSTGHFKISQIALANVPALRVALAGYKPQEYRLGEIATPKNWVVVLEKEECVSAFTMGGTILDQEGKPVSVATKLQGPGAAATSASKISGKYTLRLCGVAEGDLVKLTVQAEGYVPLDTTLAVAARHNLVLRKAAIIPASRRPVFSGRPVLPGGVFSNEDFEVTVEGLPPMLEWRLVEGSTFGIPGTIEIYRREQTAPIMEQYSWDNIFVTIRKPGYKVLRERIKLPTYDHTFQLEDSVMSEIGSSAVPPIIQQMIDDMVYVRGGVFVFGSAPNQEKGKRVSVSSFEMTKYEITQAQWEALMGPNPTMSKGCPTCPIANIDPNDLDEFLTRLINRTGLDFRLPSPAEWEYAARGGKQAKEYTDILVPTYLYAGSSELDAVGWFGKNSGKQPHPVGQKKPNELGLYDMTGNVKEYVLDEYGDFYLRGGGWNSAASGCRVEYSEAVEGSLEDVGVRLVLIKGQ